MKGHNKAFEHQTPKTYDFAISHGSVLITSACFIDFLVSESTDHVVSD